MILFFIHFMNVKNKIDYDKLPVSKLNYNTSAWTFWQQDSLLTMT